MFGLRCLRHPLHLALRLWSAGRRVSLASGAVVFGAGDSHGAMSFARRERGRFVGCSGFAVFCFAASALGALGVLAAFEALNLAVLSNKKSPLECGLYVWLRGLDLNLRPSGYEPDELPGCSTPRPAQIPLGFVAATQSACALRICAEQIAKQFVSRS